MMRHYAAVKSLEPFFLPYVDEFLVLGARLFQVQPDHVSLLAPALLYLSA
jgi:hypothetical protein